MSERLEKNIFIAVLIFLHLVAPGEKLDWANLSNRRLKLYKE